MCTVTFLPLSENEFILTSSRDVPYTRKVADHPKKYMEEGVELTYPKDGDAGGTWIGSSSKKRLICLLNGGYKNHVSKESYRLSRGIIVKELLKADDINHALNTIDLFDIEPFTLVVVDWNLELELIDFVWTGAKKHKFTIPQVPHIWSSSTLYPDRVKKMREVWFENWQSINHNFTRDTIVNFHKTAGNGNPKENVLMKRDGGGTVSITSVLLKNGEIDFSYQDMLSED